MRSMTGYGRGEADCGGVKLSVELSTVNRKQSEIVLNLPRDLTELEARIRQAINARISRGRTNVLVDASCHALMERGVLLSMLGWRVLIMMPCAHCKKNWAHPVKSLSTRFCRRLG